MKLTLIDSAVIRLLVGPFNSAVPDKRGDEAVAFWGLNCIYVLLAGVNGTESPAFFLCDIDISENLV